MLSETGSPEDAVPGVSPTVCNICRQRKVRCDRRQPTCEYCFKGGFQCDYVTSNRRRGLRAGYVSELEKRIALLEQEFLLFKQQQQETRSVNQNQSLATTHSSPSRIAHSQDEVESFHPVQNSLAPTGRKVPHEVFVKLVSIWFESYHQWHPILHQPSVEDFLNFRGANSDETHDLVLKAIAALILPSWYPEPLSAAERVSWSQSLRSEVLFRAVSEVTFHGLQAMLILSILDYGNGSLSRFWNVMGICQRLSMQLGLRDLVVNYCINYGKPSIIPPRMLRIPSTTVGYEERIRAFWVSEILDSTSTLGVAWNFHIPRPEINVWTPCGDDIWSFPEGIISMFPFGGSEAPGSFSLYVRLVSHELWHIHNFLQQPCDMTLPEGQVQRQTACQEVDQRLLKWQSEFENIAAANSPSVMGADSGVQSANVIQTYCTIDSAVIVLYQRMVQIPGTADGTTKIWYHASSRCLQACNHMVSILRSVEDEYLERMSPHLIACVFVAARFYILHAKAIQVEVPTKLDLLAYVLKACGKRWLLARRLEKVLRAAIAGHNANSFRIPLPEQFYDLEYSWPDIDDALQKWDQDMVGC